jgi:glucosamine kinase
MPNLLLAESGSTKTDWCLLQENGKAVHFKTPGINPYLQTTTEIHELLEKELKWKKGKHHADLICFYGAGAGAVANQKILAGTLKAFFDIKKVEVQSDLTAAARSLCGKDPGIVCILGTGSNSCYYDGKKIKEQQVSLGFIAGDEGSGNYMGKRVLQYYAYNTFDPELRAGFEMLFGNDLPAMLRTLYREPFPNRYLASMVQLLTANRGHFMIENIIEDCLNDFFHHHILKYRQSWKQSIHFTGSVAFHFKDVIKSLCQQYELEMGTIVQSPLKGLIKYHSEKA